MKAIIRISYHVSPDFRYNLLIVCGGNGCKHIIKYNMELRGYGTSMKVKYETHHGRVKMAETKEYPTTTARCPFGDYYPDVKCFVAQSIDGMWTIFPGTYQGQANCRQG